MKVALSLTVENMKSLQNMSLVGIPSPITILSFVENLLIKSGLINPKDGNSGVKVAYGIRKFKYSSSRYIRKTMGLGSDQNVNATSDESFLSDAEIQIYFDLNTKKGELDIKEVLKKVIPFLRFQSGIIKHFNLRIGEYAYIVLFPTFMVYDSTEEMKDNNDFLDQVAIFSNRAVIKGYQFLSDINDGQVYAESVMGLVELKALRKSSMDNIHFWTFKNTQKQILVKGE